MPGLPRPSPAELTARLDRLPATRHLWGLAFRLSLGAFFEMFDLFLTAYVSPLLIRAGIFQPNGHGWLGLSDQATFAAATFGGLFVGTMLFSSVADRFGRRPIFTYSLLWYTAATLMMATQSTAGGLEAWRFVAGIGLGVELVTIDAYLAELMPASVRGRAFAFNAFVQFLAIPTVALLCWLFAARAPLGLAGWRWVLVLSGLGAIAVWVLRSGLPESPRWLIRRGRAAEAETVIAGLEARAGAETGGPLPPPAPAGAGEIAADGSFADIWRPPYRRWTVMLAVFNFFQTIGFYGFGNWLPLLLAAQGATILKSLEYSFIIAIAYPLAPLLCLPFADRFEAKWQVVAAALGVGLFGLIFAQQRSAAGLILCGVLVTASNCLMSYAYHAYQTELFPTRIRARAVGFCYSWSRLSTVFTSFMVAFFLGHFGAGGVYVFIAASMAVVVLAIGGFGPRTRGLALEAISQ
jgi:MFS transporter, putative metabolite:H+ symporter